jgi:hypothetical protein
LIAALKNIWIKDEAYEALKKIVRPPRPFGSDRKKWKKWWKENKGKFLEKK